MIIDQNLSKEDFPALIEVWEAAARATHDFLAPGEIERLKPLILENYLPLMQLACVRTDTGGIAGFLGRAADKVEMLFVHPNSMGQGIGKALMLFAIQQWKVDKVDVNEENNGAQLFYSKLGFQSIGRAELDGEGNPHPVLFLKLMD